MLLYALPDGDAAVHEQWLSARLISSSRRNLEDEIRSGRLREDLYYRLNGVCLRLPPLRHRKEDIPSLVELFLTKYAALFARAKLSLSTQTLDRLTEYSWPGNIRQLENTVKKIVALGDEDLALGDSESFASESGGRVSLKQAARAASQHTERELILKTLERTHWNRKRAARELQISYKALLYKLKQIGLDNSVDQFNPPGENP
jgi:DNA-binding NtrC family response regulator